MNRDLDFNQRVGFDTFEVPGWKNAEHKVKMSNHIDHASHLQLVQAMPNGEDAQKGRKFHRQWTRWARAPTELIVDAAGPGGDMRHLPTSFIQLLWSRLHHGARLLL